MLKSVSTGSVFCFSNDNQSKFNVSNFECFAVIFHEVITVSIFLAQQIPTKTDLRCFEKLGPGFRDSDILQKSSIKKVAL